MKAAPQSRTPGLSDTILTALVEARRLRTGPVSIEALAADAYGKDRPAEYEASIRCAVGRLRTSGRDIQCSGKRYWITERVPASSALKDRAGLILGRIRAQSWQGRSR